MRSWVSEKTALWAVRRVKMKKTAAYYHAEKRATELTEDTDRAQASKRTLSLVKEDFGGGYESELSTNVFIAGVL